MQMANRLSGVMECASSCWAAGGLDDAGSSSARAPGRPPPLSVHSTESPRPDLDFMGRVLAWWAASTAPSWASMSQAVGPRSNRRAGTDSLGRWTTRWPSGSAARLWRGRAGKRSHRNPAGRSLDAGNERLALLVLGPRINSLVYGRAERDLAGTLSFPAAIALKNAELVERLHSAATTDELTGLLNRRALEERIEAEISRSQRHQIKTSLVLIDVDRFKLINDTLGHAAGDRYLTLIGRSCSRKCGRWTWSAAWAATSSW